MEKGKVNLNNMNSQTHQGNRNTLKTATTIKKPVVSQSAEWMWSLVSSSKARSPVSYLPKDSMLRKLYPTQERMHDS